MSAELILVLLQTSRLCLEAIERYQSGEMSDDDLRIFARGMQQRLVLANQVWESVPNVSTSARPEHAVERKIEQIETSIKSGARRSPKRFRLPEDGR